MANRVPIFDPDRSFRVWAIWEIYTEESGTYIPNVNDAVWDWDNGLYRVVAIDIETGLSTLERYSFIPQNPSLTPDDILLGAVPGRASEAFRLYVNDKTDPNTAVADSRLFLYGEDNRYIRYFKGFDISENGTVISLFYNEDNVLVDDKIPLELAVYPEGENRAVKTPLPGYVSMDLEDGEVVTCVVYGASGLAHSTNPLLVKNTAYVRTSQMASKYITHLSIESAFLIASTEDRLEVPLHTPVNDIIDKVLIHYSNGSITEITPNDSNVTIEGLESFEYTRANRTVSFSVTYRLSENEANYTSNADNGKTITNIYQIGVLAPVPEGVVKLFVLPTWDDSITGWRLIYYLYNLDRTLSLDVTEKVKVLEPPDRGFHPTDYGNLQKLRLSIDLAKVEEVISDYNYTQLFDITLFSSIGTLVPSWTYTYSDVGDIIYGDTQVAKFETVTRNNTVDISQGLYDVNTWINLMFNSNYPLLQPETNVPLLPTHVTLEYKGETVEVSVEEAMSLIAFQVTPRKGDTLYLRWISRIEARDLELAITPLLII